MNFKRKYILLCFPFKPSMKAFICFSYDLFNDKLKKKKEFPFIKL